MNKDQLFEFKEINCPVCDSADHLRVGSRGGEAHQSGQGVKTQIVRCAVCSHQFPNPMPFPKAGLDELYIDAENYFLGHDIEAKKLRGLELMAQFEEKNGKKGTFLDVGCGLGELLWAAGEAGWDAKGIDPSPEFIRVGKEKLGVNGKVGTLDDVRYPDNSFDAIALGGIIEHLYDPFSTLREIHRILKPNGWLWFDAPNEDGLYMRVGNLYMRLRGRDWVVVLAPTFPPFHVQGFNPTSLKKMLARCAFRASKPRMFGEISPQTGESSFAKKVENRVGYLINAVDKLRGSGMYMSVWAQKENV